MKLQERITLEAGKRGGKSYIRGLRITVYDILGWLASGITQKGIIEDFPELEIEDIQASLLFTLGHNRRLMFFGISLDKIFNIDASTYQHFVKHYSSSHEQKILTLLSSDPEEVSSEIIGNLYSQTQEYIDEHYEFLIDLKGEEYAKQKYREMKLYSLKEIDTRLLIEDSGDNNLSTRELLNWWILSENIRGISANKYLKNSIEYYIEGVVNNLFDQVFTGIRSRYLWNIRELNSIEDEYYLMEKMASVFVYPDYYDLVSEPTKDNWHKNSKGKLKLSSERKMELLLIGHYFWEGMWIAKKKPFPINDDKGWLVCTDLSFSPPDNIENLDLLTYEYNHLSSLQRHRYRDWSQEKIKIIPFQECPDVVELVRVIYPQEITKDNRPFFIDNNPHNLLKENIVVKSKRGRRMYCKRCGKETIKEQSKVIRDNVDKHRYCYDCLSGKIKTSIDKL